MKEFKLNIDTQDIIIQVPNDIEIIREEAFAIALLKLQEIIVDGTYAIRQRVWPCLACGKLFKNQTKLMAHVRKDEHIKKEEPLHFLADKHMKKKEEAVSQKR